MISPYCNNKYIFSKKFQIQLETMIKKWKKNHIVKITWLFHAVYS